MIYCNYSASILANSDKEKLVDLAKYILHYFGDAKDLTSISTVDEATNS